MLLKNLLSKRHLSFFVISNSNYKLEVQIIHDLEASSYCPFIQFHFNPVVQIMGTALASHARNSLLNQTEPLKLLTQILTNSNCTSHFTNK